MKKIVIGFIAIVLLALGVYYFAFSRSTLTSRMSQSQEKVVVRLGWLGSAQFGGMYVAKEKGFYQEEGLDVDLKEYENGLNNVDQVVSNSATFSITAPIEILIARQSGKPVKAVATIYQISPLAFMSLKTAGITSPSDLKGKVLGIKGGTPQTRLKYLALLEKAGLTEKDVTFKNLDYSTSEVSDILEGRADIIDVYRTNQPYELEQKGIAYNLLLPEVYGVTGYGDTIITTDSIIKTKPSVVKGFVTATAKGWEYATVHPEEALQIIAKYQNKLYSDPKLEKYILTQSIPLVQVTGGRSIGTMDYVTWNEASIRMKTGGLLPNNFDVTTAYTTQFLPQ
jgi:ABC-type nitrate/sulfonate/bicarbonate transport system substrate-binding protein